MLNDLREWRDEWATALNGGNVTDGTVEVYLRGVDQFLGWLGDAHPDVDEIAHVTRKHGDEWLGHLTHERQLIEATRRVRLLAIRFWFDYIVDEHDSGVDINPFAKIPLPVPKEKPVPVCPTESYRRCSIQLQAAISSVFAIRRSSVCCWTQGLAAARWWASTWTTWTSNTSRSA